MSAVSLQGVPCATGVGHCGFKSCTRAESLTICRSFGGRTTADSCREDTGTTLLVTTMHADVLQHKQKGTQNTGQVAVLLMLRNTCVHVAKAQRMSPNIHCRASSSVTGADSSTYTGSYVCCAGDGLSLFESDWLQSIRVAFQGWAVWVRNCRH